MTESFLHYIWQFQYFDKNQLQTTAGESVHVLHPGIKNTNAGPDFSEARIKIGNLEWRGSVEIHIASSGWMAHHHQTDAAYENVILHVVWEEDKIVHRTDGSRMPTVMLRDRVDNLLWKRYRKLITSVDVIPCSGSIHKVNSVTRLSMLDRVLLQRLEAKARDVYDFLKKNANDWEETAYKLLVKNFGFKVNSEPMSQLAAALPFKIVRKHADQLHQVEALLFGVAGFLDKVKEDDYASLLKKEFDVLSRKYGLSGKMLHKSQWRFLRLRPSNFPTVRLAQLAVLLSKQKNLFSTFTTSDPGQLIDLFTLRQSEYWRNHYQFGRTVKAVPFFGKSSADNLLINTVVPLLVAYGKQQDEQHYIDKAVTLLQHIPAEKNKFTRQFGSIGWKVNSSFDSQALLELYSSYCQKRRCLECTIGASLIKSG